MSFDFRPRWAHEQIDETRCRASVHEGGRGVGFHQCRRTPVGDGRYCRQHSPEGEAARRARSDQRYQEQREADAGRRERSAVALLRGLGYTVVPPGGRA